VTSILEQCQAVLGQGQTLEALARQYPDDWDTVRAQTTALIKDGNAALLKSHLQKTKSVQDHWVQKIKAARAEPRVAREGLRHLVRTRMTMMTIDRQLRAALARPQTTGDRPRRFDMWVAERLCFTRQRARKAVGAKWFKFWWSKLRGQGAIIAGLQKLGLYAVYSTDLISELKTLIAGRRCSELAAGDGTLAHLLTQAGVQVQASDDQSWGDKLRYPSWVEVSDAVTALRRQTPEAVVCSWPPPDNSFEAEIFKTPSVDLYVVIGSKHRYACGNWDSYDAQREFEWGIDERLSALVMPPGLDAAVLVFRRRPT
jgi:hypothetical protein